MDQPDAEAVGDLVPQVRYDERARENRWFLGDQRLAGVAVPAFSGWPEFPPTHPPLWAEADPGEWSRDRSPAHQGAFGLRCRP